MTAADPPASAVVWDGESPRSRIHGDVYFTRDDGLAEARAVFLTGCGLPAAWAGRRLFTVAELGFGTGLNVAALLDLWSRTRGPGARLHVFTVESHPLSAAEAARALSAWPQIAPVAALLTERWPGRARGFHRIDIPELGAVVDVAILEAAEALAGWNGAADAWFLDGFAPALNPDIWREEVIDLVARRSAPGARAATYTVAGVVRRRLAAAGFAVERLPGHGRKRERLEARLPGTAPERRPPRVAIVGAGIAGASLARAFGALGVMPRIFDPEGPGAGASGAPAGLMAPRLDAGLGPGAALFAQAARRAAQLYEATHGAVIARGALQLATGPKDPGRFAAIAGSDLFEPGAMGRLDAATASTRLGEPAAEGLWIGGALVIRTAAVVAAWAAAAAPARVASLNWTGDFWQLSGVNGVVLCEADVVCLACAMEVTRFAPGLNLTPVRGQLSFTEAAQWNVPTVFGAYVIPTGRGLLLGATHDRDNSATEARAADRQRNLVAAATALPALARRLEGAPMTDWAAIRATTRDYLPLAGPVPGAKGPGLLTLTGLGSRGFCLAPLLAEHLAAGALGAPSPLPGPLATLVDPGRFATRAARRGRPQSHAPVGDS